MTLQHIDTPQSAHNRTGLILGGLWETEFWTFLRMTVLNPLIGLKRTFCFFHHCLRETEGKSGLSNLSTRGGRHEFMFVKHKHGLWEVFKKIHGLPVHSRVSQKLVVLKASPHVYRTIQAPHIEIAKQQHNDFEGHRNILNTCAVLSIGFWPSRDCPSLHRRSARGASEQLVFGLNFYPKHQLWLKFVKTFGWIVHRSPSFFFGSGKVREGKKH